MKAKNDREQTEPHYLIIPAAGLGKRMRAVNPDLPKELLPIGKKPAIQYTVEEGLSAGIKDIIIIINREKEIIREYFEDKKQLNYGDLFSPVCAEDLKKIRQECSLMFMYQKNPLGESDALSYAENIAGNHAVAVMYPDNVYLPAPGALKILKPVFNQFGTEVIALNEVSDHISHTLSNAGRVDIDHLTDNVFRIQKFHAKTEGHFVPRFHRELRACGIYISGSFIFKYVARARDTVKEGEFTDIYVRNLILKEKGMIGCKLPGTVFDIGNPKGYALCLEYVQKCSRWL